MIIIILLISYALAVIVTSYLFSIQFVQVYTSPFLWQADSANSLASPTICGITIRDITLRAIKS